MVTTIATSGLDEATIQELSAGLRGELIRPGHPGYDEARKVFNTMIDKKPALIARCAGAADVISAVKFARTNHLLVAVRGGGHNITGNAVCDGGIVIDLSRMKGVRIDPAYSTAGIAMRGRSNGSGDGVEGISATGVGGFFAGGAAALHLVPAQTTGHPLSALHLRGDLLMDRTGTLWVCVASGTPGTWHKILTAAR